MTKPPHIAQKFFEPVAKQQEQLSKDSRTALVISELMGQALRDVLLAHTNLRPMKADGLVEMVQKQYYKLTTNPDHAMPLIKDTEVVDMGREARLALRVIRLTNEAAKTILVIEIGISDKDAMAIIQAMNRRYEVIISGKQEK